MKLKYLNEQYQQYEDALKRKEQLKANGYDVVLIPIRSYYVVRYGIVKGLGQRKRIMNVPK